MSGLWLWALLLTVSLGAQSAHGVCTEACWEQCFEKLGSESERYRDVWDNILEIGLEINYLKDVYNISKIGFLIDSALSKRHNILEKASTENLENGNNIFKFQVWIAMAVALMVNGQHNFIAQYDDDAAWTCKEFNCLADSCATVQALNRLSFVEMDQSSFCPGDVEAACMLLNNEITENSCGTNQNTMAIAITNGDFLINKFESGHRHRRSNREHSDEDEEICPKLRRESSDSDDWDIISPCHSYFSTRYVIGTHHPSRENMEQFPSKHGHYRYINDEEFSYNALSNLVRCMLGSTPPACCPAFPATPLPVTTCSKTQGLLGEVVYNFTTHQALLNQTQTVLGTLP